MNRSGIGHRIGALAVAATVRLPVILLAAIVGTSCGTASKHAASTDDPSLRVVHSISLPGASADGVSMDYLAYDRSQHRVWVPAGNTARWMWWTPSPAASR